jgi:hypothetical protein
MLSSRKAIKLCSIVYTLLFIFCTNFNQMCKYKTFFGAYKLNRRKNSD